MRTIFRYINSIWAIFVFTLFIIGGRFYYFFAHKIYGINRFGHIFKYNEIWVSTWCFLTGVKCKLVGREKLNPKQQYVLAPNHTSLGDIIIATKAMNGLKVAPLGKIEVEKIPLMGPMFKHACVLVNRSDPKSRAKSVEEMKSLGRQHISILIFPEGTRNKSGETPLLPFHSGAFRVAIDLQVPIVPMAFINARAMMPKDKFPLHRCTITALFGEPIPTEGMTQRDAPQLKKQVYEVMEKMVIDNEERYKALR